MATGACSAGHRGSRRACIRRLAGFVEPGESLEDALRREVFEEVGVDHRRHGSVSRVAALAFPQSLMLGFRARRGYRLVHRLERDRGRRLVRPGRPKRTRLGGRSGCRTRIASPGSCSMSGWPRAADAPAQPGSAVRRRVGERPAAATAAVRANRNSIDRRRAGATAVAGGPDHAGGVAVGDDQPFFRPAGYRAGNPGRVAK